MFSREWFLEICGELSGNLGAARANVTAHHSISYPVSAGLQAAGPGLLMWGSLNGESRLYACMHVGSVAGRRGRGHATMPPMNRNQPTANERLRLLVRLRRAARTRHALTPKLAATSFVC